MFNDSRTRFSQDIIVQYEDIDELGHVNNTVYLNYIEELTRSHAISNTMTLDAMRLLGAIPVAHKHTIVYHRPARLGEVLTASTQITFTSGPRAARHNEIRRATDNTLLVEIDSEWVWIDPIRWRPRAAPAAILACFGIVEVRKVPM